MVSSESGMKPQAQAVDDQREIQIHRSNHATDGIV